MPKGASASDVVYWINWAIDNSPERYIHNVVINCHGTPGFLHVGGSWKGFGDSGTSLFSPLRGRGAVGRIMLVACQIANDGAANEIGKNFCSKLAKESGAFVIGADEFQSVDLMYEWISHPHGSIDDYEGTPFEFSPAGGWKVWHPSSQ